MASRQGSQPTTPRAPPPVPRPVPPPVPLPALAPAKEPGRAQTRQPTVFVPTGGMPMAGPMAWPLAGPMARPVARMPTTGMPVAGGQMNARRGPYVQMPIPGLAPLAVPQYRGCPAGLEYLKKIDQLLVHQQVDLLESFLPWEMANKYVVKNSMSQFVFAAAEQSNIVARQLTRNRSFLISLVDYRNVIVMRLFRPLRCDCSLCWCCLQVMDVHDGSGAVMGHIRMECTILNPNFSVLDSENNAVLMIRGPLWTSSICFEDVVFDILTMDGVTKIGAITKVWGGLLKEYFTDADNFAVTFPLDLNVKIKAVLLGAVFLIDFIYFETTGAQRQPDLPGNVIN
ncbi:phospholipid scramblase 3-like [Dermacentor variabilis]|uniref:phospholipid scramblase 3-like n=1 Tax=Dermacentor variabilis TaxID=34621 RepID=UPI003F5C3252